MPLAQLWEKIPTKYLNPGLPSVTFWPKLMISAKPTLSHNSDGSFLGWPETNFQGRVTCLQAEKKRQQALLFDLNLLAPLFTRTVDTTPHIVPLTAAPPSLCSRVCPESSHHNTTSHLQSCCNSEAHVRPSFSPWWQDTGYITATLSELIKTWHVSILLKLIFSRISEMIWLSTQQHASTWGPWPDAADQQKLTTNLRISPPRHSTGKGWEIPSHRKRGRDGGSAGLTLLQ